MSVQVGSAVSVGWDYDSYEAGLAAGQVVAWVSDPTRNDDHVPACIVRLNDLLVTHVRPKAPHEQPEQVSGSYLLLTTRYVGQTWDENEGTVHAYLHADEPIDLDLSSAYKAPRIASHAVYRVT